MSWISPREYAGIPQTLQFKAFEASRAFPDFSPPQHGWGRLVFRNGSREGLSGLVMEFPAVLRVFLKDEAHYLNHHQLRYHALWPRTPLPMRNESCSPMPSTAHTHLRHRESREKRLNARLQDCMVGVDPALFRPNKHALRNISLRVTIRNFKGICRIAGKEGPLQRMMHQKHRICKKMI